MWLPRQQRPQPRKTNSRVRDVADGMPCGLRRLRFVDRAGRAARLCGAQLPSWPGVYESTIDDDSRPSGCDDDARDADREMDRSGSR